MISGISAFPITVLFIDNFIMLIGQQRQLSIQNLKFNLYIADARLIHLYDNESRLSEVDDLGIGLIIPHSEGTIPLSKHILNNTYRNETAVLFFSTSPRILSIQ